MKKQGKLLVEDRKWVAVLWLTSLLFILLSAGMVLVRDHAELWFAGWILTACCQMWPLGLVERRRAAYEELFKARYPDVYWQRENDTNAWGFPRQTGCAVPQDMELQQLWDEYESAQNIRIPRRGFILLLVIGVLMISRIMQHLW